MSNFVGNDQAAVFEFFHDHLVGDELDLMSQVGEDSLQGAQADVEFHSTVARATGNPLYLQLFEFVQQRMFEARKLAWQNSSALGVGPAPAIAEHQALLPHCRLTPEDQIRKIKQRALIVHDELSADSLLVGQLRDLCDLCQRQEGKALALVGWHIGCKIDTTTPMGEMMFTLMAGMAQLERRMIAERTATALQHKKATGQKYTNQTPYGFEAIEGRLVQVLAETEVVAEIQAARSSGNTLQYIADSLNGRGIPTKTGKQWAPATIHLLLKRSSLVNPV